MRCFAGVICGVSDAPNTANPGQRCKTLYNHYHDKYDLAEQVMIGIGRDLRAHIE